MAVRRLNRAEDIEHVQKAVESINSYLACLRQCDEYAMALTKETEPEALLRTSDIDVELIQQLTKYWLVTVEQQGNEILIKLYAK